MTSRYPTLSLGCALGALILLALFSRTAAAEPPLPSRTEGSLHVSHYLGVNGANDRTPVFGGGTSLEVRVLFASRAGFGLTAGGEINGADTLAFCGGGPRLRLTPPHWATDVTLGYDLRVMRLRKFELDIFGGLPPPEEFVTAAHAFSLRVEGPMSPSGAWRFGGYLEAGVAHDGLGRWASFGMSVGFGGRRR